MNHRTSLLCRRNLRAYAAAFISYLMLAGQVAPLALAAAAPRAAAPASAATSAPRPAPASEAVAPVNAARPEPAPLPFFVPTITATKVDSWDDTATPDGKAEPGQVVTYTVTITNTGPDPATGVQFSDVGDPNTSLVPGSVQTQPVAQADTASAFGNVRIATSQGAPNLLANDCDPDDTTGPCNDNLTASGPTTSTNNGNVVVNADGTFEYNPFPGFTGSDTFTYTIRDKGPDNIANNADDKTDTAVMTITVGPTLIWFIDDDAAPGGDGRITAPFNTIAAFNAVDVDDPGDIIFLYAGTYTGGITLENNEKVIGQGFLLSTETGTAPAGSNTLPAAVVTGPTINNPNANIITLSSGGALTGNTLRGFNTGNSGTTGTDISGTTFGTLTVSDLSINGDGRALNLTTGTLAATVANISASSTGSLDGLTLNGVGGTLTVSTNTNITNPGGDGIDISNAPAGHNFNFGAAIVTKNAAGVAVTLSTNAGTTSFTSLTITNSSGAGFVTNNAGTVNVSAGSITTTGTGVAASFTNTTLGLTLTSVSSNGGANGLIISGGSGTFTSGTTTLVNNAGVGLSMSSSAVVASFGNTTVNSSAGDAVDLSSNSGNITFADLDMAPDAGLRGLDAQNNTGTITATSGDITTSGGGTASAVFIDGPHPSPTNGRTPINLTFTTVTTSGVGSGSASVSIVDASGTKFQVTGTTQINTRSGRGVFVDNTTATTIQFATVNIPNPSNAGGNAFHIEDSSSTVTVSTATISDANQTTQQTDGGSDGIPDTDGDGDAIFLRGNTGNFTLSGGTLSNCGNDCIDARNSVNVALSGLTITNPGVDTTGATGEGAGGHGIAFINLTGTNTVTSTTISGFNVANRDGLYLVNNTGTTATTVHGTTFQNSTGNAGIVAESASNANITLTVGGPTNNVATNCTFTNISGSAIIANSADTSTLNVTIQRSTFQTAPTDGKTNITGLNSQTADVVWNILNNTFTNVMKTASTAEGVIQISSLGTGSGNNFGANVSGNTISGVGQNSSVCSGGVTFCAGPFFAIGMVVDGTTGVPNTIVVDGNTITNAQQGGMKLDMVNSGTGSTAVNAKIINNSFGTDASRIGVGPASIAARSGITVERRRNNSPAGNVLISGNTVRSGSGINGNTLNDPGIFARTKANSNLSVTVTNNNVDANIGGGVAEMRFDTNANDVGDIVSPTMCVDVTGNTLPAGAAAVIDFNEINGTLNVEQASTAAVSAANSGATVTVNGGETFGFACATPPAGPVSGGGSDALMGAAMVGVPVIQSDEAKPKSAFGGGVTDRPFIGMPRTAPKAAAATTVAPRTAPASKPADAAAQANNTTTTAEQTAPVTTREGDLKKKLRAPVQTDDPGGPNGTGVGISGLNIGTLAPGDSVTITFQVTVDNPYTGGPNVSNQGVVSGSNFSNVNTDDPDTVAVGDATLTPINANEIYINNAQVAEPASPNTVDMTFTVSLKQPATGAITVNFVTADQTATAGTCGNPGADYVSSNGQVAFATGEQVKTINVPICSDAVADDGETFVVNLSGASGATLVDNQAVGTITANTAGTFLISELRTSGPGGSADDFVELYNNSDAPLTVTASDSSAGYGVFKMGADCNATPILLGVIPNTTVIPARGHYLLVGSAYSLSNYGGTGAAAGNLTMTSDIENDRNVGVFSTSNVVNISTTNRLDAVGFGTNVGGACNLLREPSNLGAASGSTLEHTYFRKQCDFVPVAGCMTPGNPKDTNDNSADFLFADTAGMAIAGTGQLLGAPGPENMASPIRRDNTGAVSVPLLDGTKPSSAEPNRHRDLLDTGTNKTFGTMSIRRRVVNTSGAPITRLRVRVVEMTTFPITVGGNADLRVLTSSDITVSAVNDTGTCAAESESPPCTVDVRGTTLEQPPNQPDGGGYNSTLTVTLGTPLPAGQAVNVQFLLGIETTGKFRFYIIVEALP